MYQSWFGPRRLAALTLGVLAIVVTTLPAAADNSSSRDNNTPFPTSTSIIDAQWETPRFTSYVISSTVGAMQFGDNLPTTWGADGNNYVMIDDGQAQGPTQPISGVNVTTQVTNNPPTNNTTAPSLTFNVQGADQWLYCHHTYSGAGPEFGPQSSTHACYAAGMTERQGILYTAVITDNVRDNCSPDPGCPSPYGLHEINYSTNGGQTWTEGNHPFTWPANGSLNFVEEGQDITPTGHTTWDGNVNPDGYVYAVTSGLYPQAPITVSENLSGLFLGRVLPGAITVTNPTQWQWFAGLNANNSPIWTSSGVTATARSITGTVGQPYDSMNPTVFWNHHIVNQQMTYDPAIQRYLLTFTYNFYDGFANGFTDPGACSSLGLGNDPLYCDVYTAGAELVVLEAPHPWGPFNFVMREPYFGSGNGYDPVFPIKWESPVSNNGQDLWLAWSSNFVSCTGTSLSQGCGGPGCSYHVRADLCQGVYTMNLRRVHFSLAGASGVLPASWAHQDVGAGGPGATVYNTGTFTVTGNGSDIWDPHDQFQYAYQVLGGDGQLVARINSVSAPAKDWGGSASAGVMIREQTPVISGTIAVAPGDVMSDTARYAYVPLYDYNQGVGFQWRDGAGSHLTSATAQAAPVWLKLMRSGDTLSGYYSSNGTSWTLKKTVTLLNLSRTVKVGLAVTSNTTDTLDTFPVPATQYATGVFDNVALSVDDGVTSTNGVTNANGTASPNPNQFNYVGTNWTHYVDTGGAGGYYNNTLSWDNVANDYATVTFYGRQISYYSNKEPYAGKAGVSIDGGSETLVDCYASTPTGNQLVWTSPLLTPGMHTLKIRVTGTKNPNAVDYFIEPDRVEIVS